MSLSSWEAEISRILVGGHPVQKIHKSALSQPIAETYACHPKLLGRVRLGGSQLPATQAETSVRPISTKKLGMVMHTYLPNDSGEVKIGG
jgi:hypothetical protein